MDLVGSITDDKNMETNTTSEDVLVVLQTESGEQIALPMSALPSDFVPGESGQIIMVESALDEQQEVVVESSDTSAIVGSVTATSDSHPNNTENLVSLHVHETDLLQHLSLPTSSTKDDTLVTTLAGDVISQHEISTVQLQSTNSSDKPTPRTYSRNNVKSYAPTCGATRIYQQSQDATPSQVSCEETNHREGNNSETMTTPSVQLDNESATITNETATTLATASADNETSSSEITATEISTVVTTPKPPHKKQKRKETLLTRPLNEEDIELEFQIIEEPTPMIQEVEVKRKPRKEYRTKKRVRLALEKLSKEDAAKNEEAKKKVVKEVKKDISRRELPKRGASKEKIVEEKLPTTTKSSPLHQHPPTITSPTLQPPVQTPPKTHPQPQQPQPQPQPQTERRTRLSNTCRVATGKSYKCNDCDFSTDRINNIILHVKESCPKLKRI